MDQSKALEIVSALADGANPFTGEAIPAGGLLGQPEVSEALLVARKAMLVEIQRTSRKFERAAKRAEQWAGRRGLSAPTAAADATGGKFGHGGAPWTADEEERLITELKAGEPLEQVARLHGRTDGAILTRLKRVIQSGHIPHDSAEELKHRYLDYDPAAIQMNSHVRAIVHDDDASLPAKGDVASETGERVSDLARRRIVRGELMAGTRWSKEEDLRLLAEFRSMRPQSEIAAEHMRSEVAIHDRLIALSEIPDDRPDHLKRARSIPLVPVPRTS